jgi:hypothetical protein
MTLRKLFVACALAPLATVVTAAPAVKFEVKPNEFDPAKSNLVQAAWLEGIGCPTAVKAQVFQPPDFSTTAEEIITDPACVTGDPNDKSTEGLLLAKTGPTANNASAVAELKGLTKGLVIAELGYDIRKPGADTSAGPRGSHCGAGSPRFNVVTADGTTYFIGCNSPPATTQVPGQGWIRLRWGGAAPLLAFPQLGGGPVDIRGMQVDSISIVLDEGQDAGPDNFGLAVLDNIDVNGTIVGRGATDAS